MNTIYLTILSIAVFMSACADPAANKPKAQTSEPATNVVPQIAVASNNDDADLKAAGTALPVTPENSKVAFTGSKVTGKHEGGFKSFKGMIDLVEDNAEASRVSVDIDMTSVYTDTDGLTKHLQTGDFFAVEKFPKSSFASTKIISDAGKGERNYTITGDLEMRGVTKTITFPATITITPETVAVKAEFSINRKDFGIAYAGKADDLIRDDVVIKLDLKAPRKK